jgi:regulator of replication initiation timing
MIDNMSVRQLKRALRLAKEKAAKAVDKAVEKLNKENAELKDEVDTLKAALSDEDIEAAKKLMDKAGKKLTDAIDLLRQLPRELLARDGFMRQAAFAVLAEVKGSAEYLEMEIAELANPDPGETVRKHMARLRGQAEAQGAEHSES